MKKQSLKESKKGFSLIEVLIALVLLEVALIYIAQLYTAALHAEYRSRKRSDFTFIGQRKVEELYMKDFDDVQLSPQMPCNPVWDFLCYDTNHKNPTTTQDASSLTYFTAWSVEEINNNIKIVSLYVIPYSLYQSFSQGKNIPGTAIKPVEFVFTINK